MNIDGRALAEQLNLQTQQRIGRLPFRPLLVDVLVGNDPASLSYVGIKQRTAQKYGLAFELAHLPADSTTQEIVDVIEASSKRDELCGLIVQLPLPGHVDQIEIINSIPLAVDVDLLNEQSANGFYANAADVNGFSLVPPTAGAIMHIIDSLPEPWDQKQFAVVGRGDLVGMPVAHLLRSRGYKVEVVHSQTLNPDELLRQADCIILGVGKPNFLNGTQVKDDVIVIDAGTSESGGTIAGDANFETVSPRAKFITPVPGGVGPLTVAKLIENVVAVAEAKVSTVDTL
ncbi:bifunctional 5,10-methylenetetrahydrofolate dehydrogenase/5,10-methenyltetrahydrofolate cyclohydrolase [bacterium]|nr:MAG: bifunctional 5,10-methylenetetrahydrofolate dehydrogenase/5,10-methenyltetrahydrofolate cyclohydrolase [bacterium]